MKFSYKFILLVILLILCIFAVSLSSSVAAEIDIGDGGTFDDVQTAVDSVSDGDTI